MKEKIINNLISKGYEIKEVQTIKNGVIYNGINIMEDGYSVLPVIYIDDIIKHENKKSVEELTQLILNIHNEHKIVSFDIDKILDKNYILENVRIALQKKSNEDIIKEDTEFNGIESYLYILAKETNIGDNIGFIKVKNVILNKVNINIKEIWEAARDNTFKNTVIKNMKDMIFDLMPDIIKDEEMLAEINDNKSLVSMFVITNKEKMKGASGILNKQLLKDIAINHNCNQLIILPSSIHEVIVVPNTDSINTDINDLSSMVSEINNTQVSPEERLTDEAYVIDIN